MDNYLSLVLMFTIWTVTGTSEVRHILKHSKHRHKKLMKGEFLNTWAVIVHGDERMALTVAAENGFVTKGKIFGDVYEFVHTGIPRRRKREAFKKTLHLKRDPRVVWAQQQVAKIRQKRIYFNDDKWSDQWYLHRDDSSKYAGHDMNVVPVWKQGITGKGVVVSILDDGIEYTHPELQKNYDPKASYDFNSNDNDPIPRYTWREDNRHGTRCAAEVAAVSNNSLCIVGVAYGASIGGIRMLDGRVTDLIESKSLSFAKNHIDIYSSSWGPEDDGMTVDGPGELTRVALLQGSRVGRKGKGSIVVWASGNGGAHHDNCNCDGYTNSIFTISVSAATSVGVQPWYLESCASTLVSAYSSGFSKNERSIVTADLRSSDPNGGCTYAHTGTSVSAPLIAGFIALALEANPYLTWRDVQHILVETSSLEHLIGHDFRSNGVGKRYSHHFGYGIVNGEELVNLARKWHTAGKQCKCYHKKEIKKFPYNSFNKSSPLVLRINTTACRGTSQHLRYVEHVHVKVTLYHERRGAAEVLIISPMGTESWVLRERRKDTKPGEFQDWLFLSTHFWGEDPLGVWTVKFISKEPNETVQGFLQDMNLILYGTHEKPGVKSAVDEGTPTKSITCHEQCAQGCSGSKNHQCNQCKNYHYIGSGKEKFCVGKCPEDMYSVKDSSLCRTCHKSCKSCTGGNSTDCTSCPLSHALLSGKCMEVCPASMFKEQSPNSKWFHCRKCAARCTACYGHAENCSACNQGSILTGNTCVAKCSSSHWLDGEKCSKCHPTCKTCVGGTHINCTSCKKKVLNDVEDRFLYKDRECVSACPLRTFRANTIMQDCLDCPANCLKCSQDGRKCDVCDVNYYMITSADGQCVKTCPDGYYTDIVNRVCEPCDLHCKSCVPGNPSACTSCLGDYFLKAHECVAKSECKMKYYVNETSGKCHVCPTTCTFCESAEVCTQCFLSYFMTPDDKCVAKCPVGTYAFQRDKCQPCASSCMECDGPTSSDCLTCPEDRYLFNGQCIENIPPGYYVELSGRQKTLKRCHQTCTECTGPKLKDCVTCIAKFDKREEGCVNPCPEQWLSLNKCDNCHPSCGSCYGPKANQCLVCNNNFSLNADTHSCSKGCHRKYYKDPNSFVCRPCHHSCASCFGPAANQCRSCPDKFQFHNNTCVWQCPAGWYKTFNRKCAPCSKRCQKCLYKYDLCTVCHANHVLKDFKCLKSCGPNKYHDSSHRCYRCHESCLTCQSNAANQCLSCFPGMTLVNGMCIVGCLPGSYNSTVLQKCTPCMKNCLRCSESTDRKLMCNVCSNDTLLLPNGKCSNSCPAGTYRKPLENVCGVCPGKDCIDCQESLGKKCSKCKPLRAITSNGLCKSICGIGNYPNDTYTECKKCHPLCFSCTGPSEENCVQCETHAFKLKIPEKRIVKCVSACPVGYYSSHKMCKPCPHNCKQCKDEETCSICEANMVLFNDTCLHECPVGFMSGKENTCVPCEVLYDRCSSCNSTACLQCKTGFYMMNGSCVADCGLVYTHDKHRCIPCNSFTAKCIRCSNVSCNLCEEGFILNATTCIAGCAEGYIMLDGVCNKCENVNCSNEVKTTKEPKLVSQIITTDTVGTTKVTTSIKLPVLSVAKKILSNATEQATKTTKTTELNTTLQADKLFTLITKADTSIVEAAEEKEIEKEEFIDKLPTNIMPVLDEKKIVGKNVIDNSTISKDITKNGKVVNTTKTSTSSLPLDLVITNDTDATEPNLAIAVDPDKHPKRRLKRSIAENQVAHEEGEVQHLLTSGVLLLTMSFCLLGVIGIVFWRRKFIDKRNKMCLENTNEVNVEN